MSQGFVSSAAATTAHSLEYRLKEMIVPFRRVFFDCAQDRLR
jgi:hypothetical protein